MVKNCIFKSCRNTVRSSNDPRTKQIFFVPFPKPTTQLEKCKRWVSIINRDGLTVFSVKRNHYVCSKHFVGENGPTPEFPDPIPIKDDPKTPSETEINHLRRSSKTYSKRDAYCNFSGESGKSSECDLLLSVSNHSISDQEPLIYEEKHHPSHIAIDNGIIMKENEIEMLAVVKTEPENVDEIVSKESVHLNQAGVEDAQEGLQHTQESVQHVQESVQHVEESVQHVRESVQHVQESVQHVQYIENVPCQGIFSLDELRKEYFLHQAYNLTALLWNVQYKQNQENLRVVKLSAKACFIAVEISVDLELDILPCDKLLDTQHPLFHLNKKKISVLQDLLFILNNIDNWTVCEGIEETYINYSNSLNSVKVCETSRTLRHNKCELLFESSRTTKCKRCRNAKVVIQKRKKRMLTQDRSLGRLNLRYMSMEEIRKRNQTSKLKKQALKRKIIRLQAKIHKNLTKDIEKQKSWLQMSDSD